MCLCCLFVFWVCRYGLRCLSCLLLCFLVGNFWDANCIWNKVLPWPHDHWIRSHQTIELHQFMIKSRQTFLHPEFPPFQPLDIYTAKYDICQWNLQIVPSNTKWRPWCPTKKHIHQPFAFRRSPAFQSVKRKPWADTWWSSSKLLQHLPWYHDVIKL